MSGKPDGAASQGYPYAIEVLDYLNLKAGRTFRPVPANLKFIMARLKDSTVDEMKAVIDRQVALWKDDDKMAAYLRPETLFNATKFETYRQAPTKAAASGVRSAK